MNADGDRRTTAADPAWLVPVAAGIVPALVVANSLAAAAWLALGGALGGAAVLLAALALRRLPGWAAMPVVLLASAGALAGAEAAAAAWLPGIREALGVYLPVTMMSCLLLQGAGEASRGATAAATARPMLRRTLGLVAGLAAVALVREALGAGSVTLPSLPAGWAFGLPALRDAPASALLLPFGGLIVAAYLAAVARAIGRGVARRAKGGMQ